MSTTLLHNYESIAKAIQYIQDNVNKQPSLDEVAAHVHISPFHFQRMFSEWAGVSPKKFLRFITLSYAKSLLKQPQATLFDTTETLGLSSTSRLHDLFVTIEGMTPAEYKNGGAELIITYSFVETIFGKAIVANTAKGVCYLAFIDDNQHAFNRLQKQFYDAKLIEKLHETHTTIANNINNAYNSEPITLHIKGTDFQLKVWEALLRIPFGKLETYGNIAANISNTKASRAVGTAIGDNPIAYIIPCHRVIQSSGALGGYMWGTTRKTAIIGWEASKCNTL
jgi:AraC family transcriptional regulator, regulatory protein of adaptative response / methylated-DNA-[protein]-cysteine methyltransferase